MKLPRRQYSIRSWMIAIVLVTTLVSMPVQGWRWGTRAKEEVRARWGVVERLQDMLGQCETIVENKERRSPPPSGTA